MAEGAGPAVDEEGGLIEEGQIVDAPSSPCATSARREQLDLVGGEQTLTDLGQPIRAPEDAAHERLGGDRGPQSVEGRLERIGGDELALERRVIGLEPASLAQRAAKQAGQPRPQGRPPRLVGAPGGRDGVGQMVDQWGVEVRPHHPGAEGNLPVEVSALGDEPPSQHLGHSGVTLQPAGGRWVLEVGPDSRREIAHRRLDHRLLTERRQNLGDVAEKGS